MADRADVAAARRALGMQLAAARESAGLIQEQLAAQIVYSRGSVANAEIGRQNPARQFWLRCDDVLNTGTALVDGYDEILLLVKRQRSADAETAQAQRHIHTGAAVTSDLSHSHPRSSDAGVRPAGSTPPQPDHEEDVIDVLRRLHQRNLVLDPDIIDQLDDNLDDALTGYEQRDPTSLSVMLAKQRIWIETLLGECATSGQRRHLFEIAAGTAGLLDYIAVGRGRFPLARAYCAEAFQLGTLAQRPDLQAWVRGVESFTAYYAGRYDHALRYALDGLRYVRSGPQSVRLTINGAARALGKLGDADGVRRAVDDAFDLLARNNAPSGLPSSIAFGCYSEAQTASNAATAYLSLGMPTHVQQYVEMALPEITASDSPWSRSLVMIDLAGAVAAGADADLDRASQLAIDALNISPTGPSSRSISAPVASSPAPPPDGALRHSSAPSATRWPRQ